MVRLVHGGQTNLNKGRVEICFEGQWGTVCGYYQWNYFDAEVVCRQLGFGTAGEFIYFSFSNLWLNEDMYKRFGKSVEFKKYLHGICDAGSLDRVYMV